MIYTQPRIHPGNFYGILRYKRITNLSQTTRPSDSQQKKKKTEKKKRTCRIVDLAVPADYGVKLKQSEKKDTNVDLARELKKSWNMKVTGIKIVVDALGTINKGLVLGLEALEIKGWVETIQTTALLKLARILRRVLETWGDLESHQLTMMWKTLKENNNLFRLRFIVSSIPLKYE